MTKINKLIKLSTLFTTTALASMCIAVRNRFEDQLNGQDHFAEHSRLEHKKHPFSGMHAPYLTSNVQEQAVFKKYFSNFQYLLPSSIEQFKKKQALQTSVKILPLSSCPISINEPLKDAPLLAVGGPPALVFAAVQAMNNKRVDYLNDSRRWPIAKGSAYHLEQDATTEAPTTYTPINFLFDQSVRAIYKHISHSLVEKTGQFPWRTLNWIGWLQHPTHWWLGIKLALAVQLSFNNKLEKEKIYLQVEKQCKENQRIYDQLNQALKGKLLLPGKGSLIVARTSEELDDLSRMKTQLTQENRILRQLSSKELIERFGFVPSGLQHFEKPHDAILSPNYQLLLEDYITSQGNEVLDATLVKVYVDSENSTIGGIAEYQINGKSYFKTFSQIILSLGNQNVLDKNNNPLFNVVAARGVSVLAHVYLPEDYCLPPVLVCGTTTTHATKLSDQPITISRKDKKCHLYLVRITAGACITPNVSDENTADYDGTIAVGLISAVRLTLGNECEIEPLFVYGCNRQVCEHGQITWLNPYPGVHIQHGAGGGGLTRAPDFLTKFEEKNLFRFEI